MPPRPVDPQSTALTVAYLELNADRPWLGSLPLLARRSAPSLCSDRGVEGPPAAAAEAVLSLLTGGKSPGLASMINQSRRSEPSAPVGCGGGWDKWIGWSQVSQRVGEPQAGRRPPFGRPGPKPHPVDTTARPSAQRWIPRWLRGPACRWRPFHSRQWHADGPLALNPLRHPPFGPRRLDAAVDAGVCHRIGPNRGRLRGESVCSDALWHAGALASFDFGPAAR